MMDFMLTDEEKADLARVDDYSCCRAISAMFFLCTRAGAHTGRHIAATLRDEVVAVWEDAK